ncbi:hypothetical protein Tco_1217684 [Tanacetum coccineum]
MICIIIDLNAPSSSLSTSTSTVIIDPRHDTNDSLVVMWIYSTISPKLIDMVIDDSTAHVVSLSLSSFLRNTIVVKNILKYLRRTKDMFLVYDGLDKEAITWRSSKQSTIALSSKEAEGIDVSDATHLDI